jgi:quercetin dioxygenase-like cupin family protein
MELRRWERESIEPLGTGLGRQVLHTEHLTVARIHLAAGAVVPSHHHPNEQVANVLGGRLRFTVGSDEVVVAAGESLAIPSDVPHGVVALEDSLVLDVFAPRREDWIAGDDAYLRG